MVLQVPEIPAALVGNAFSDPGTRAGADTSANGQPDPRIFGAPGRTKPDTRYVRARYCETPALSRAG